MHTAMIQLRLLYGLKKDVEKIEPKRVHEKIPKLMRFDLSANIFQGRDMQPADSNGLADPYVKIIACGVERETAVIERTLQPIWYQRLSIPLDLPRDLTLAPKVALLVFDSDPILGMNINKGSDPIIGFALCPPEHDEPQNPDGSIKEPRSMKEYFVRSGLGEPEERKPEWIDVYSIEGMEQMALFKSDPNQHDKPVNVGSILVDFELRPEQDAKKLEIKDAEREALAKKAAAREAKEKGEPPPPAPAFPMVKINTIRSMPKMIKCYLEVALIGVRDMKPRLVAGFEQAISAPYIEFEYGHRSAPERYWKTKTMLAGGGGDSSAGPNANFLDVIYLQVLLPDDPQYDPVMGVRVRDTPAVQLLPGPMAVDPICGVCAIHLKSLMPSFARYEEKREIDEAAEEEAKLAWLKAEDDRKEAEGVVEAPDPPEASNEEIEDEFVFESTAMAKGAKGKAGAGKRSVAGPDATELDDDSDSDDDDDSEEEDEDGGSAKDPIITHTMESMLKDVPFQAHNLHMGAMEPGLGEIGIRKVGVLKLQVRVIEEDNFVETIKETPAPRLRQIFREEMTKVRIHCYWATNLSSRPDGKAPAPFLKVYNGTGGHQVKTGKVMDNTINPEFWTSFELAAMLPGQAILHVELWDYTLLKENLIGGTTIDLEDRYYSQKWKEMQAMQKMPRELRQLTNETSSNVQGNIIMKLEIFPVGFARANPMEQLAPPKKTQFELRVVIWEAKDVATKDGGQSDVFVTIQPRGEAEYEKQSTDTHWFSTGEAEFNWRMIWPLFLPEKVPRLFMQVWDQDVIGADDAIGEAELNLKPMLDKVLKKGAGAKQDGMWIATTHPNFKGVQARIRISLEVCTVAESIIKPAGNRRDAPNENPFLEMPIRPGLFDGLGLSFKFFNPMMLLMKYRVKCCICCIIIGVVAGLVLYMSM